MLDAAFRCEERPKNIVYKPVRMECSDLKHEAQKKGIRSGILGKFPYFVKTVEVIFIIRRDTNSFSTENQLRVR